MVQLIFIIIRILNVVLNYFTLTTYFWMLCEGTYLQLLLVNTFQVGYLHEINNFQVGTYLKQLLVNNFQVGAYLQLLPD